ncbi:hypothetical protein HOV23_gp032 [Pseudomonas phage Lana]|uniref:Uncharacterized protein n=1 Tax=Pseudomonas phage Lana TaxID=2530172 RepID=A0A481W617_9CAUD|nr:hypothetical protein HOV23_gp032 [Pseudomonas phage Lana]QBJ04541.1 hypothetical protein [Pseudomonas phage Lana]
MIPKNLTIGCKALITTNDWFIAPDGGSYKAAFGTVHAVLDSQQALGVKTNARSTNWYVELGSLTIAGCQIHYAFKTEQCNLGPAKSYNVKEGQLNEYVQPSNIYDADKEYEPCLHTLTN